MDYLTFSKATFVENEKLANTAIDIINKQMGLPDGKGTNTCSDLIKHPDGIQTAINLISGVDSIAQKLDLTTLLDGKYTKGSLPDEWYKDPVNKEFSETKFDQTKVDPEKEPPPKDGK